MAQGKVPVNRTLVGAIATVCLVLGAALWVVERDNPNPVWPGAFVRVGLLMSAFWLALPTKTREAAWVHVSPFTLIGLLLALFVVVRFPRRAIPLIIVLAVLGLILKPRQRRPPRKPPP